MTSKHIPEDELARWYEELPEITLPTEEPVWEVFESDIWKLLEQDRAAEREAVLRELHRNQGPGLPKRNYDNETDELIDDMLAELSRPEAEKP